ncbi:hypothetical protein [Lutibaculum baratangense]|uniref:Uncharacterized protein n=1 Tax=Lutibaculum baratangense AMV1 TaxID=631454 RepID=V4TD00_9HYPH|nr:hypothetical protein [Lutibaculum baratangense]ESR24183.1 hypothetical protein N177_2632 [Lutibaculum baratangense AMV1]
MAKKGKSKRKRKLPKKILGVKVPKPLRRGPFADFLLSPAGQEIIAGLLFRAAASFARDPKRASAAAREAALHPAATIRGLGSSDWLRDLVAAGAASLNHALGEAVQHFLDTLREGRETDGTTRDRSSERSGEEARQQESSRAEEGAERPGDARRDDGGEEDPGEAPRSEEDDERRGDDGQADR